MFCFGFYVLFCVWEVLACSSVLNPDTLECNCQPVELLSVSSHGNGCVCGETQTHGGEKKEEDYE